MTKFTEEQMKNLDKLATYLEQLPKNYKNFDMEQFIDKDFRLNQKQIIDYALNNGGVDKFSCGTVACAVGHGPSAGILMTKEEAKNFNRGGAFAWNEYSKRFCNQDFIEWEWMFGSEWNDVDNTHRGAAARIRYILAGNELPEYIHKKYDTYGFVPTRYMRKLYKEFRV